MNLITSSSFFKNRAKKTKEANVITRANHRGHRQLYWVQFYFRMDEKVIRVYEANYAVM